jgi:tyrosyl-tRNA synthetase
MNILDDLQWRGLMADCTDLAGLRERTAQGPITLYCGFDPTAESLHVGNLVPLLALRRFQLAGHHPIALAGGATGCIGDPSGKTQERQLLSRETIAHNIACIKEQLKRLLDFNCASNPARLVDNADWMAPITYLDFLRDVGKHFSVNAMIAKESVRARMEDRDTGISYTEFSYMLLQAYDFYHLRKELHCELQIGGSDQWGNITAGIDLARKKLGVTLYGLTLPLITNADGSKFGKSLSGAIYLDSQKTSVYRFYQFWIRTDDRDVIRYLKYFTFLGREEIDALEQKHQANPGAREAHRALAWAMTEMVHGPTAAREAVRASEVLFGGDLEGISAATFQEILGEAPTRLVQPGVLEGTGWPLVEAVVAAGLSPSKGQARKDIESGGIYVNNVRVAEVQRALTPSDLLFGQYLLLRKGKKNYVIVSFQSA